MGGRPGALPPLRSRLTQSEAVHAARRALEPIFADASASLTRLSERTRELDEAPRYDEETNAQFVHGFATIVREALAGEGRAARDLYTEAAAAVVASDGRSAASLARSLVTFGVLVGEEIALTVERDARAEAATWLARFLGEWTEELLDAAAGEAT